MEGSERGGNQFRRANIVYFLSHNGAIEHPHLIRIHHLRSNGVHLHDVKRWLAELRGKDMPGSFAWSYKRRYKSGYVWQDLKDDDLITPISDNEYVLKGSFLRFHSLEFPCDETGKKARASKEVAEKATTTEEHAEEVDPETKAEALDSERDDSQRRMAVFKIDATVTAAATATARREEQEERRTYKRDYSSKASHVFRSILTCGADAKDSVLLPICRTGEGGHRRRRSTGDVPRQGNKSAEAENARRSRASGGGGKRAGCASYKPATAPDCSQCGRPFEPDKLHSHMQSCKALRGRGVDKMPLQRGSRSALSDFAQQSTSRDGGC